MEPVCCHMMPVYMPPQYSTLSYWNKRYSKISETYDWYSIWPSLKTHLPFELESGSNILHIGCGSSRLGQDLYDEGVRNVKNIDISPVCIDGMKAMFPHLDYEVMDVFDIGSHFKGPTFDFVIDKGCLDTLLCQENCEELIPAMLKELHGLLRYLRS
ncbi:TPA methylase, putative [Babesia ovis]|uniref:TPA methylase, putative n=1 Tax=Babesia ovis TaxID=5869 RepID=A0A9W5TAP4_BABOV|nr:TPA methylase, putative [Babesia ovis]